MNTAFIIKRAILSEKAYAQMAKGIYAFKVDRQATKKEIASAIKKQFSVEVRKINIISQSPTKRKITGTRREVEVLGGKKAIVYLKAGQTISVLSPKAESKSKATKVSKVSKDSKEKTSESKGFLSKITKSSKDTRLKKEDK